MTHDNGAYVILRSRLRLESEPEIHATFDHRYEAVIENGKLNHGQGEPGYWYWVRKADSPEVWEIQERERLRANAR